MIVTTREEMAAIDCTAIDQYKIAGIVLMENAGREIVRLMTARYDLPKGACIPIFIGPGNNGGDGLVIARHLLQLQCRPILFYLIDPGSLQGDALINQRIVDQLAIEACIISDSSRVQLLAQLLIQVAAADSIKVMVDAIFGTGLDRDIRSHFAEAITTINSFSRNHNIEVVAVDIASGLDGNTGQIHNTCVKASLTGTLCYPKIGHFSGFGPKMSGELVVLDIGIPHTIAPQKNITRTALTLSEIGSTVGIHNKTYDTHKGDNGHLLILAGSVGKTGATILAARGALRSGCGLVTIASPQQLHAIFETAVAEAMTSVLPTQQPKLTMSEYDLIGALCENKKVVVLGPGIGTDDQTAELVIALYERCPLPMIVDADALTAIAAVKHTLKPPAGIRILTPHPGEMARLLQCETADVQNDRMAAALRCLEIYGQAAHEVIIALKGAGTVIASRKRIAINTTGNPGMATGGMGDVLAGIIGAYICQAIPPATAVEHGVFFHGRSADLLLETSGIGYNAGEVADMVPFCIKHCKEISI
jgi:hydroxyethylthiazole kinase-like uncharacterized protein yjeF